MLIAGRGSAKVLPIWSCHHEGEDGMSASGSAGNGSDTMEAGEAAGPASKRPAGGTAQLNAIASAAAKFGTWRFDVASNRLECSDEALILMGITRRDWGGTPEALEAFVHPDDLERRRRDRAAALSEGELLQHEFRIICPDGRVRWLHSRGNIARDAAGRAVEAYGVVIDITEQKRAETALRATEERLAAEATALTRLNEASSRLWRMRSLRDGLEEMLAATIELLGADMGIVQLLDPERKSLVVAAQRGHATLDGLREVAAHEHSACGRALRSSAPTMIEDVETDPLYVPFRAIARAAGYRAVLSTPLIGTDGTPLGLLSMQFRSAHRASEQDLRRLDLYARQASDFIERCRRDEALRKSERRFRATFDNAAVGMAHVAPDGSLLRVNDRLCQILGWSAEELVTKTFQDITQPDDLDANLALLERALSGQRDHYEMEKRYRRKDGSTIWAHLTAGCVRKDDGSVDYFISVVEDISERKKREEQVQLLMREISHRAKNLLSVVQVMARHSARTADPQGFAERFSRRLAGLAASHDLLVKSAWRGVAIADLVRSQLAHFGDLVGSRVTARGPALRLRPAAAQTVGMALHELATNAAKYGALSNATGSIRFEWGLLGSEGEARIRLRWAEYGGPAPSEVHRRGFGHTVMVEMVERGLDAAVRLGYPSTGAVWECIAPAAWMLDPDPHEPLTRRNGTLTQSGPAD
jgi:PAS domain S-box-containing protein